jgi:ribosomal-protein-alanine N-acetyltransferase
MALEKQNPLAAHWTQPQYDSLFLPATIGEPSQRFAWVADDESRGEDRTIPILGFLVAHKVDTGWELENIAVSETSHRRGVGTLLLAALIAHARSAKGSRIFLEVRESNHTARALYRKAGFEEAGLRKGYYANPAEDAILYRLSL